jgi:predicted glycosyltransferase
LKILFYLGHPAHFHLFRPVINNLVEAKNQVKVLIKKKDILEDLVKRSGWDYENILPKGRKDNLISIGFGQIQRDITLYNITRKFVPDIMLGTSAEIGHIGKLKNIPSVVVNEDDAEVVPLFARLSYPFASHIVAPSSCNVGKWEYKRISYEGYHELSYLHPNVFKAGRKFVEPLFQDQKRYFILRFAQLTAHHDSGKSGITRTIAQRLIQLLEPHGHVYITSERKLEEEFEKYRINIDPLKIHHALYYADMYIGDSQTMAAEAAVLGTPAIRFNDFVGKIGYLEELEHKYGLTYGIPTKNPEHLYTKIALLLSIHDIKKEWHIKREIMLREKIDVSTFMTWLVEKYPESAHILKENPDYQYKFR